MDSEQSKHFGEVMMRAMRAESFTVDGEAVVVSADGVAIFDALLRRRRAADAIL